MTHLSQTQSLRYNEGKLRPTLIDYPSLTPLLEVLEYGAKKYAIDNWKNPMELKSILDSLLRHTHALASGETHDEESNLQHIGHIMANAMFFSYHANKNTNE